MEENSTCKLFGVPIVTAGEIKRERDRRRRESKRKGYCECCKEKYDDVDKHLQGEQHKTFVRNKKNFDALDRLINQGPNTVCFLQSILLKHCVQKAANKSSSNKTCEKDVKQVQDTTQNQSSKTPELPPEQLRVERKVNRRHRTDRKQDQSRKLVIEIERTNLIENQIADRKLKSSFHNKTEETTKGYSSPSKRSYSFPGVDKDDAQSTAAVVIRRSGSRGVYGSPRRSQSSSVRSEKTLVIRDSPIASLQPLRDFLSKHSTRSDSDDKNKSVSSSDRTDADFKKRKSSSSDSQSPSRKKRLRASNEVQAEVTVHSYGNSEKLSFVKDKKKHEKTKSNAQLIPHDDETLTNQGKMSLRGTHTGESQLSPRKKSCYDLAKEPSPRKSLRLSSQCTENEVPSVDLTRSSVHQNLKPRSQNAEIGEKSQTAYEKFELPLWTRSSDDFVICVESPKCKLRQRKESDSKTKPHSDTAKIVDKEVKEMEEESDLENSNTLSTRLRSSPRKQMKMKQEKEFHEFDTSKGNVCSTQDKKEKHVEVASDKTVSVVKRRKWKKIVQSSPNKKKGKKLTKLKLDESQCSDLSVVSDISPQKPVDFVEHVNSKTQHIYVNDSSSPTFKKHCKKEETLEVRCTRPVSETLADSPVFKRRSRHCYTQETSVSGVTTGIQVKDSLEKTPRHCKSAKASKDDDSEFDTPKSGYSSTPRQVRRSRRNIASELLDQTLCEDEIDFDVKDMPEQQKTKVKSLSPVRSDRKSRSSSQEGDLCGSPVKSRSRKGRQPNVPTLEKAITEQIPHVYLDVSPSRKRGSSSLPASTHETTREQSKKRQKISPDMCKVSTSKLISKSPRKDSKVAVEKSPVKITIKDGLDIDQLKLRSCFVSIKSDNLEVTSPMKHNAKKGRRKWRRFNSGSKSTTKTVKLNRSWLLLSERSMSKLLESEGDQEPFLGFSKAESDKQLPSDLTFEEVSEVDMSEDSTREWVIEEPTSEDKDDDLDETLIEETSLVKQIFPSPDKASNSSWGDACDTFLQSTCEKRLKEQICSTPLLLSSKNRSPSMKKKSRKSHPSGNKNSNRNDGTANIFTVTDPYTTPRKSGKLSPKNINEGGEIKVDQDIVFNFNYNSPKRKSDGVKKLFKEQRKTIAREEKNNSDSLSGKPLRLLKKASDTKKTFKMSYVSKQAKSPKPKQRLNIESGQTVVIVSPKNKHK